MHDAFYATVATVTPILLIGEVYLVKVADFSDRALHWLFYVLAISAAFSVFASLLALGGIWPDSDVLHWILCMLLLTIVLIGVVGLIAQTYGTASSEGDGRPPSRRRRKR